MKDCRKFSEKERKVKDFLKSPRYQCEFGVSYNQSRTEAERS